MSGYRWERGRQIETKAKVLVYIALAVWIRVCDQLDTWCSI